MRTLILIFSLFSIVAVSARAASPENSEAFYIEPMELRIDPAATVAPSVASSVAPSKLRIVNKDDRSSRIRVDVFERSDSVEGSEQRTLTRDVRVGASEFTIPAGGSKDIAVTYHGGKKLSRERAFRIVVKQIAALEGSSRSLDLRFIYVASVYVTPKRAEPRFVVQEVRRASDREIEVDFRNDGNAHMKMSEMKAVVEQGDSEKTRQIELSAESQKMLSRQNLLAGGRRKFVLQIAAGERSVSDAPLTVKLVKSSAAITGR